MKQARDPDALRAAFTARKLSHRQVGRLAGCSRGVPGKLLSGGRVSDDLARRIARALDRPLDVLFQDAMSTGEIPIVNVQASA